MTDTTPLPAPAPALAPTPDDRDIGPDADRDVDRDADRDVDRDVGPDVDRDPAQVVTAMVEHVLALAATWLSWDGIPIPSEDRIYTPHKAVRRVADHLIDHLAEMEARLAGEEPVPDHWHASMITTAADLAVFTRADLEEARSRLIRLGRIWADRLGALSDEQLDDSPGTGWTIRELALHLGGSVYYADAVGDLGPARETRPHR